MSTEDVRRHDAPRRARATRCAGLFWFLWIVFAVALHAGCGSAPTEDWENQLKPCPTDADIGRLEPFDRFELRVYDEKEMTGEYEVSPSGTINFPLLGTLEVAGKRCDEIEALLTERLAAEVLREPSVVCVSRTMERTAVTVQGQVRKPGVVEYRKGMMLTDAVASAEGLTVRAASNSVTITRKLRDGTTQSVTVPYDDILQAEASNVCLHPGDTVFVPQTVF